MHPPSAEEIRAQLGRITASATLADSHRLVALLTYVVEETLAGRGAQLKEYQVGVDVFRRPESFDPRTDSLVRAQGTRLRAKLSEYYAGAGARDPIEIQLPRGSYVPAFAYNAVEKPQVSEQPAASRRWLWIGAGAVVLSLTAWLLWANGAKPHASGTSVAVLPFVNMTADAQNEYFSDGLTEEIIDALAKISELRVVARTSVFQFKGRAGDIRQIGKTLNVGAVLEGSVRKTGDRFRITAQLNDVASGYHLWSETYDAAGGDIFRVQREIAASIARALLATRQPASTIDARRAGTSNVEAYHLYLQARYFFNQWGIEADLKAVDYAQQAIAKDPGYAQAYALLAQAYNILGGPQRLDRANLMAKSLAASEKALELDPESAEAHTAMGMYHAIYNWDFKQADEHLSRALELEPGSALVHDAYGWYQTTLGNFANAEKLLKRAVELDPLSFNAMTEIGTLYASQGRAEEALEQVRRVLLLNPSFPTAQGNLVRDLVDLGRLDEAQEALKKLTSVDAANRVALQALVAAKRGDRPGALRLLAELEKSTFSPRAGPISVARVYMVLGEHAQAIEQLSRARKQRDAYFVFAMLASRDFAPLHGDPRFEELKKTLAFSR